MRSSSSATEPFSDCNTLARPPVAPPRAPLSIMSLTYTLLLASDAAPDDVRRDVASREDFERVGDALRGPGVTVTVAEAPAFTRAVARDESGLDPSLLVGMDLHREHLEEGEGTALALAARLARSFGGDAFLKYLGDYPVFAYREGTLVADPGWAAARPELAARLGDGVETDPLPGEPWA